MQNGDVRDVTPPRGLDRGGYKLLEWVQGIALHVWGGKKIKKVDLDHWSKSFPLYSVPHSGRQKIEMVRK